MAEFSILKIADTTVTISITGLASGDEVRIFIRLADDPDNTTVDEKYTTPSTTMMKILTGLEPGTDYLVNVGIVVNVDGTNVTEWIGAQSFATANETTEPDPDRPEDWEWYSTIEQGAEINISAEEWNDFCSQVNAFRVYQGLAEYDFTIVESGDEISADIVNEARTAMGPLPFEESRPSAVSAGDDITAAFFVELAACLNSVP